MKIEELVKQLIVLATKPLLSKTEHAEAVESMKQLKAFGMSNDEISNLSKGKWTASTVKFYTPGIKPTHPTPWENKGALLDKILAAGLTLEDIEVALTLYEDLQSKGINLEQVIALLLAADSQSIDIGKFIQQVEVLKESGLSPDHVSEAIGLKQKMEAMGLSLDSVPALAKLAATYGSAQNVLEAVSVYGSLSAINTEANGAKNKLEKLDTEIASANHKLEQTQAQIAQLAAPLQAYNKALETGFDEKKLADLASLSSKFGGLKGIFKALAGYTDYAEINDKVSKAKSQLAGLEAEIGKLSAQHSHLTSAVSMCQVLISQYKFGLDAIATMASVAKKYGDPAAVLKAVDEYGNLEALHQENTKLEGAISELKREIARLQGQYKEATDKLESLNTMALKVGQEVGKIQGQVAASDGVKKLLELVDNPKSADYAGQIPNALLVAVSLRKWVSTHEDKFKSAYNIKSGLESLVKELGGLP